MAARVLVTWILVGLCLGGAGALAWEWLHPPRFQEPGPAPEAALPLPTVEPFQGFNIAPLSQYEEIIERPLFLAERRPAAAATTEAPPPAPEPPKDEWPLTLLGVVLAPQATMALVQDNKTGQVTRLAVGEQIHGWQLQAVEANSVSLISGGTVRSLPLERNKKKAPGRRPGTRPPQAMYPPPGAAPPIAIPQPAVPQPMVPQPEPPPELTQ